MSTILQSVKKKIYAVCPEVMELSFGCEIKVEEDEDVWRITSKVYGGNFYCVCPKTFELANRCLHTTQVKAILGHPLGLPEVLRAMKSELQFHHEPTQLWFRTKRPDYVLPPDKWIVWNLLVNLDGQSEAVWKFLDEIL